MLEALRSLALSSVILALGSACGSSPPPVAEPPPTEAPPAAPEPAPAPPSDAPVEAPPSDSGTSTSRPALTAEECAAQQGTAVGDIGDGAIHRPDYKCPSGKAPLGNISAAPGGPMAVEGEVCCPK